MSVNEEMTALANEVRRLSGAEGKLGVVAMTEKLAGVEVGGGSGESTDALWRAIQTNGERKDYTNLFSGKSWTKDLFKPKYDMRPSTMRNMFYRFDEANSDETTWLDLVERLETLGLILDTSECTNFESAFYFSKFSRLGIIDLRKATNSISTFYNVSAHTIEKLIVPDNVAITGNLSFDWASKLKNIEIEGICAMNIGMGWAPLTKASILSIMNSLSGTVTGKTVTLKKSAVNTAFETVAGLNDGSTSQEWLDLVATKTNWTISLA